MNQVQARNNFLAALEHGAESDQQPCASREREPGSAHIPDGENIEQV